MSSTNVGIFLSPSELVKHKYFLPSQMSVAKYSKKMNLRHDQLRRVLEGGGLSPDFIEKFSRATGTEQSYWYYLQSDYQFFKYCEKLKNSKGIASIRPIVYQGESKRVVGNESVGKLIFQKFIESIQSMSSFCRKAKISHHMLRRILDGSVRIDGSIANKLCNATGFGSEHWLELQTRQDIDQLLASNRRLSPEVRFELENYRFNRGSEGGQKHHPGWVLSNQFMQTIKLPLINWCQLLFTTKKKLRQLIITKGELPLLMILKLSQLCNTTISFWLDLQIKYYSSKDQETNEELRPPFDLHLPPGRILMRDFIVPMNRTVADFGKCIGVSPQKVYNVVTNRIKIDFDFAARLGKALGTDPNYWLRIQIDHQLQLRTSKTK